MVRLRENSSVLELSAARDALASATEEATMWKEVSEKRYNEALGVVPPIWIGNGFLLGEPHDHRLCTVTNKIKPTYAAFIYAFGKYWEGDPMTINEFQLFDANDLLKAP
jgi:hypothetical protein